MGISYLIVTLALGGTQNDMFMESASLFGDRYESGNVSSVLASGENPWALPVPETEYYNDKGKTQKPPEKVSRPRYISPEELEKLERKPQDLVPGGPQRTPLNLEGLRDRRKYGRSDYPSYGTYGYPLYPGMSEPLDPYGGVPPYLGLPYDQPLPFMY